MNQFLILYAPFMVVILAVASAFWIALKGKVTDE